MSVDTFVILRADRLPSIAEWQRAIDDAGIDIRLDAIDDLRQHTGYLPVMFDGTNSGFEWYFGKVEEVFGQKPDGVSNLDHAIAFITHSDEQEALCALYAAGIIAKISDGLFFDEDARAFVAGDRAFEIAARWKASEQERRAQLAAKDSALTERRCPECGAPCPTYRKTCKACGFAIGRVK